MKQKFFVFVMLTLLLAWCSFGWGDTMQEHKRNEASDYCEQNWWTIEIVPDSWGEWWKCNFDDWSFCEEWAFFHGECSQNWWNWNTVVLEDIQELQGDENLSLEEKEEISELVEEIQEHDDAANLEKIFLDSTCTQEVKQCEDGTYVGRVGENCEFAQCPWYNLDEDAVQQLLNEHNSTWSELSESDIDLMNEFIEAFTQN